MKEIRQFCECLWENFKDIAERNFLYSAKIQFFPQVWEMYLYKALQNSSHCVERGCLGNQNIDFLIKYRDRDVYIEATAPTRGEEGNENTVSDIKADGKAHKVEEDNIKLRLTSSIDEKCEKYNSSLPDKSCFVIAVCINQIMQLSNNDIHLLIGSVLPLGKQYIEIDKEDKDYCREGYKYSCEIEKVNKTKVSNDFFMNPKYENLSAVIFSFIAPLRSPSTNLVSVLCKDVGKNFFLIRNKNAKNPLPDGFISRGREFVYEVTGDRLTGQPKDIK